MYRAFISNGVVIEAEDFRPCYRAALYEVQYDLVHGEMHIATIEADGVEKYKLTPARWFHGAEDLGSTIDLIRLEDYNTITVRNLGGLEGLAKRRFSKCLLRQTEPLDKEEVSDVMCRIANDYAHDRKSFDHLVEELNKMCYNN